MITICIFHTIYHHLKPRYASHHQCSGRISAYNFRHFLWCLLGFFITFSDLLLNYSISQGKLLWKALVLSILKGILCQWILPFITCNNILDLRRKRWWHFSWDSQNSQEVSKIRWKQNNVKFLQAKTECLFSFLRTYTLPQIPRYNWHPNW